MYAVACAAICACGKSAKKQRPAMQTWVVQLSPGDVAAVPVHSYSVGGFSNMGQFAASGDGTKVVASQGLRHRGAVVIQLATKPAAKLRNDAILATDQAPLLLRGDMASGEKITDEQSGRQYELSREPEAAKFQRLAKFYRSTAAVLVRALVYSGRSGRASILERYAPGNAPPGWVNKYTEQIVGLAISKDGQHVAIGLGDGNALARLVVVRGDTGAELWQAELKQNRATSLGTDPMFFSNDGQHLVLRTGTKVQIRASATGTIAWRVDVGHSVSTGFDETGHAGFDGTHLWFFQYRAPRSKSHMLPSSGGRPVDVCGYAVFDVKRNRLMTETTTAKELDELLLGKHSGGRLCNVRAVLPLDDGGVLIVEYVAVDTLRIHRSARVPGS